MKLQVYDGGRSARRAERDAGVLATGAPKSPGPLPVELASHLRHGEPLVWWGEKTDVSWGPIAITLLIAFALLGLVTFAAPSFWSGSLADVWKPVAAVLSPALALFAREWLSRRTVLVTPDAVVSVDMRGFAVRLPYAALRRVRRDLLRGGVRLEGANSTLIVPWPLMHDTRSAIAVAREGSLGSGTPLDDPLGWMP